MIIWTGWGIVIGVIGFVCLLVTQLGVNAAMQDDQFYQTNGWPKLLACWVAAAISWPVGRAMNRGEERVVIDPASRQPIIVHAEGQHALFFIPVQYWWIVFAILGVVFACVYERG